MVKPSNQSQVKIFSHNFFLKLKNQLIILDEIGYGKRAQRDFDQLQLQKFKVNERKGLFNNWAQKGKDWIKNKFSEPYQGNYQDPRTYLPMEFD